MRSREMMARLKRLPIRRRGDEKVWDFSLLSPEKQDRFDELSDSILALCEEHGFTDGTDAPVKEQMVPLHAWRARDRTDLQHLLDIAAS